MGIVLRGATTGHQSSSASTVVANKPSGTVSGDLIMAMVASSTTAYTFSCPGFTAVTSVSNSITGQFLYRVADGTEGSTFTFTMSSGSHFSVVAVISYGGVSATNSGFDTTSGIPSTSGLFVSSSTSLDASSITTGTDGDTLVWFGFDGGGTGTPPTITAPTGYTAESTFDFYTGSTNQDCGILIADKFQSTHGATGTVSGSFSPAQLSVGLVVAITPAASPAVLQPITRPVMARIPGQRTGRAISTSPYVLPYAPTQITHPAVAYSMWSV